MFMAVLGGMGKFFLGETMIFRLRFGIFAMGFIRYHRVFDNHKLRVGQNDHDFGDPI